MDGWVDNMGWEVEEREVETGQSTDWIASRQQPESNTAAELKSVLGANLLSGSHSLRTASKEDTANCSVGRASAVH